MMGLPFFYSENLSYADKIIMLDEENSKHIIQVLRMAEGRQINITNGKGIICRAEILDANKKKCIVKSLEILEYHSPHRKVCVAVSPVKNANRFEWFLEKATEIGVTEIVPLLCERTEKQFIKFERLQSILISAMLQSQQRWLPILHQPTKFEKFVKENISNNKFIAHCEEDNKISLKEKVKAQIQNATILIGPEGDFTKSEIEFALQNNFTPVALGETRLRTETAGIVAATLLCVR